MLGTLYLVATPIGNLDDITRRAVDILRSVDVVLAEDTRRTRKLLARYEIDASLAAYHDHVEERDTPGWVDRLRDGDDLALVSDAGTPAISDPGYRLVRAAVDAGIPVVPVPGPSAVLAALTASGLPTDRFTFVGYPPRKQGERREFLQRLRHDPGTIVLLESPRRLARTLRDAADVLGDRPAAVARELTKVHEEFLRGTLPELAQRVAARSSPREEADDVQGTTDTDAEDADDTSPLRGEVTLCIGGNPEPGPPPGSGADARLQLSVQEHYTTLRRAGVPRKEALRQVARERGVSRRDVYQQVLVNGAGPEPTGADPPHDRHDD